ncbi:MAG: polysaccharide pyruvyl transferase family protein [Candidatus Bathyarchaeota archaeon]|nr:polysaccharide pyruvyl transferase family protein [Candidatus Bathyarchaeota archaeon]
MTKLLNFFITQACDVGNKGDQAIIKSEIAMLRRLFPDCAISVATWWSNDLLQRMDSNIKVHSPLVDFKIRGHDAPLIFYPFLFVLTSYLSVLSALCIKHNLAPIYRKNYLVGLKEANLVLSSGHQPFVEGSRYRQRTLWDTLANFLMLLWGSMDVLIAKKIFRKRFTTFPQSVGPFDTFVGKMFAKFIFGNMDVICVREQISKQTLNKLGVTSCIIQSIDMAFFFRPNLKQNPSIQTVVGVSPCFVAGMSENEKKRYVHVLCGTLRELLRRDDLKILLLPSQTTKGKAMSISGREDDAFLSQLIQTEMEQGKEKNVETVITESVDEFVYLIKQLDLLIANRMHPSIFAAALGVPFVEIIYEHKQAGLLEKLDLSQVGININNLTMEKLLLKIDFVWSQRSEISHKLTQKVDFLCLTDERKIEKLIVCLVSK